jgi:hypothetical protein
VRQAESAREIRLPDALSRPRRAKLITGRRRAPRPSWFATVEQGQFLKEIAVRVPVRAPESRAAAAVGANAGEAGPLYELEDLKAQLGEQVQAGQALCHLADHQSLYIEGPRQPGSGGGLDGGRPVQSNQGGAAPAGPNGLQGFFRLQGAQGRWTAPRRRR